MSGGNNQGKRGFSGLSDLVSEVDFRDEPQKQTNQIDASPPPKVTPPQQKDAPLKSQAPSAGSARPVEAAPSGSSGSGSAGKWILVGISVCFVFWLAAKDGQNNRTYSPPPAPKPQSYNAPQSSPPPVAAPPTSPRAPQNSEVQYTRPLGGTNNVLSVPEIQWCIREKIRIDAMRNYIDTNAGIDAFNLIVNDYNNLCGSYRYRKGTLPQAERSVEPYRDQIVAEAIREAKQLGNPYQPQPPSASPVSSTSSTLAKPAESSAPEKLSAQHTREAQQLLTDLGYKPGPVDGDFGRRTADAVKDFQRDAGITQNGQIDESLLAALRRAKAEYKPPVALQPKPQPQTSSQPRSSTHPAAVTVRPENLSYEEQIRYNTGQRLVRLGYKVDWRTMSLTDMLDAESRIGTANRLKRRGISVDWRNYSLSQLLNMER